MSTRWDDFFFFHFRKFAAGGLALAGAAGMLAFGGCTDDGVTVAGQVTSGGKPVVVGTVSVVGSDNQTYVAPIRPDGTYEVRGVPPGPYKVAVVSPNPQPQIGLAPQPAGAPPRADNPKPVPAAGAPTPAPAPAAGGGKAPPKEDPKKTNGRTTMAASSPVPPPQLQPTGPTLPQHQQWFPIPNKYADPSTSGVNGQATRGGTRADIKLD